ncbi:MAG: F420-0:Gamma-glutamyl ligase, partial [Prochlorothrix sp.]
MGGLAALGAFEWQYRQRPGNALDITPGFWELEERSPSHRRLVGKLELVNRTRRLEIMVPELTVKTKIFSKGSLEGVFWRTNTEANHEDMPNRADGYWFAYIVKVAKTTQITVTIDIEGDPAALAQLQSAWLRVD